MRAIVIYDSTTGSTEKVGREIARIIKCDILKVDSAMADACGYDVLFLGTPNLKGKATEKIYRFLDNTVLPKKVFIFITYKVLFFGRISSKECVDSLRRKIENHKGSSFCGSFICPGFNTKFKFYKGRPSKKDFKNLEAFLKKINPLK